MRTQYICEHCNSSFSTEQGAITCESKGKHIPFKEYPRGLMFEYHHHGYVGIFAIAEDDTFETNKHLGEQSWWACRSDAFGCGDSLGKSMTQGGLRATGELENWKQYHKITAEYVGSKEFNRMVAFLAAEGITPTYYNELGELVTVETNTFKVRSSQGEIRVDLTTGDVLGITTHEETDTHFPTIKRFDLAERKAFRGEDIPKGDNIDILDLGYWYGESMWEYAEPDHEWRKIYAELTK